jgi:site-specific DNA-methyltransferase (adenine-specific)
VSVEPFYEDESVRLLLGDMREVLPRLDVTPDAAVLDPPYGETSASWDRWVDGWPAVVGSVLPSSASLWCFGSTRMFLEHAQDFEGWKYAQEQLWIKRNGTGPGSRDRLSKVHEWAVHWYRGRWSDLHHEWEREPVDGPDKGYVRRLAPAAEHRREGRLSAWTDDGMRLRRSVVEAPSVRFEKRHQDEKPLATVLPLVRECVPPGGLVLDCFAGACTTGVAAKILGRRAVLVEADEETCEKAAVRLSQGVLELGGVA